MNKDVKDDKDLAPANDPGPVNQALTAADPQMSKNKSWQIQQALNGHYCSFMRWVEGGMLYAALRCLVSVTDEGKVE